ncbi:hypothetical protein BKP64_10740 [Marinobacter salinus]|uniref:Uncharacterized protein n=1 Tax=Marinobacter salinus TaxID=1874317 RepID=A0A1D9GM78_9GAMM|nr:hypothetical protein [Marinobacter salinus]AOY88605.1 hypothetical protein BKP64_10740 [Marinobacter salinus]
MSEHTRIYLQPECCAGEEGRLWCQDDEPQSCPDGEKWTPYILVSEFDKVKDRLEKANTRIEELENGEEVAARELLFWWAERLSNAPNENLRQVIKEGYQRIINLANVLEDTSVRVRSYAGGSGAAR